MIINDSGVKEEDGDVPIRLYDHVYENYAFGSEAGGHGNGSNRKFSCEPTDNISWMLRFESSTDRFDF